MRDKKQVIVALTDLVRRWGGRISLSLVDQALFSGANFMLNILLARWLVPEAYGAFAVAFSVLLFLAGLHGALIAEPMSVLGPSRFADGLRAYFGRLLWMHGGLTVGLSLVVAAAALLFLPSSRGMALALWGVALSQPFTLLFWLLRRACYLEAKAARAAQGSALYTAFLLAGLVLLQANDRVSAFNAWLVVGAASLGASFLLYGLLKGTLRDDPAGALGPTLRAVLDAHWRYGRWIVGASMAHSVSTVIFAPLVAAFLGLAQAGAFRAIQNLVSPLQQVVTALGTLLLPWMSKQHAAGGALLPGATMRKAVVLNTAAVAGYAVVLAVFSEDLITFLYADAYDTALRGLLVYFVGALFLMALSQPVALALRAVEQPSAILWSKLGAAACLALFGLPLIWQAGLAGAGLGLVLVALAEALVLVYCLKKTQAALCLS